MNVCWTLSLSFCVFLIFRSGRWRWGQRRANDYDYDSRVCVGETALDLD